MNRLNAFFEMGAGVWKFLNANRDYVLFFLVLFCMLAAGIHFGWVFVAALIACWLMVAFIRKQGNPKYFAYAQIASFALSAILGVWATWAFFGWFPALLVVGGLIYFGFVAGD